MRRSTFSLTQRLFQQPSWIGGEMKITIDREKCKGHNNCTAIAPNVFDVDEKFKAFVLDPKGDSDEDILKEAALVGWGILQRGGTALDAVEAAVVVLEDNPLFNAGTGSTLNSLGKSEMDAAIMEGASLRAGAVAAVRGIKNPVKLARRVMDDGRHVLLAGEGALLFARQIGVSEVSAETLIAEEQRKRWDEKHGTVGAVALAATGQTAVATSTGGILNKLPGRVGDSALLGSGTYADETGGVSCTGHGEAIIRIVMAKTALDFLRSGLDPTEAANRAVTS